MKPHVKFNIYDTIMSFIMSYILILSIFKGFNLSTNIVSIVILCFIMILLYDFLLKRPYLIILFLVLFILSDLYLFYMDKKVLVKAYMFINQFINWFSVYIGETSYPVGFKSLTNMFTPILSIFVCMVTTFIVTIFNNIIRSHFAVFLIGILVFIFQWYNFVDDAYIYMIFYIFICFINFSLKYYRKAGNGKTAIANLLVIAIIFSSISTVIAYAMPKKFTPVQWKSMNDKFYEIFPITKAWRNGIGIQNGSSISHNIFVSFSRQLGGPSDFGDHVIMRVKSDESTYLRGEVFDTYNNNEWSNNQVDYTINKGNLVPYFSENIKYTKKKIEIYPVNMNTNIIFSPWQPYNVSERYVYDVNDLNLRGMVKNLDKPYFVEYYKPEIDIQSLENTGTKTDSTMERYLQYPGNLPSRVKELALNITKGKKTVFDKVKAIEQYLRNTYPYELNVPNTPPGRDFVDYFLFDLKKGYCTYYATSMAVMLRTIGIPARYVVGFKMPDPPLFGNNYDIKASLAHAWVEVYFNNYGWITFEPTAIYSQTYNKPSEQIDSSPIDIPNNVGSNVMPGEIQNKTSIKDIRSEINLKPTTEINKFNVNKSDIIYTIIFLFMILSLLLTNLRYQYFKNKLNDNRTAVIYYYNKIVKKLGKRGIKKKDNETTIEYQYKVLSYGYKNFDKITEIYDKVIYGNVIPSNEDIKFLKNYLKRRVTINS